MVNRDDVLIARPKQRDHHFGILVNSDNPAGLINGKKIKNMLGLIIDFNFQGLKKRMLYPSKLFN